MSHTIKDIAASLGLSVATVSRALHDEHSPYVSQRTRTRVREVARSLGYRPNHSARSLATGRSQMFGMWVGYLYAPYFAKVARCLHRHASAHQRQILLKDLFLDGTNPDFWSPANWAVDGVLAVDIHDEACQQLLELAEKRLPVVSTGVEVLKTKDYVKVDLFASSQAATRHLLEIGSQRVAFLGGPTDESRFLAYLSVMEEANREPEVIPLRGVERKEVRECARAYFQQHGCPDAIFCKNDDMAIGTYRALHDLGLRIPEDVALVGCDGIEDTEFLDTPITTIVQPVEEMCALAWKFLENRIQDPSLPPQRAILQSTLVLRESSCR